MRVLMLTGDASSDVNQQAAFMRSAGVDVEIYTPASLKLRHALRMRRELRRFLKKQHFDLVHAQFAQAGSLARGIWAGPLVVTIHAIDVARAKVPAAMVVGRFIWRRLGLFGAKVCDEAVVFQPELPPQLPRRPYHVVPDQSPKEMIGIYQLARATHAAMVN